MRHAPCLLVVALSLGCGRAALVDDAPDSGPGGGLAAGGTAGGQAGGAGGSAGGGSTGGGSAGGQSGGAAGGASDPCAPLGVSACRADARCTPDFCFQCSCEPRFAQCRLKTAPPFECPRFGCPQPQCCVDDSTCGRPLVCVRVEQPPTCGACNNLPSTCTTDATCGRGQVCLPRRCACSGQTDCQPGCGPDNPCRRGQVCDAATRRCEDLRCSDATPCPSGMDCILGPAGSVCAPRACTDDRECGDVFCVSGLCSASHGTCGAFAP